MRPKKLDLYGRISVEIENEPFPRLYQLKLPFAQYRIKVNGQVKSRIRFALFPVVFVPLHHLPRRDSRGCRLWYPRIRVPIHLEKSGKSEHFSNAGKSQGNFISLIWKNYFDIKPLKRYFLAIHVLCMLRWPQKCIIFCLSSDY